MDTDERHLLIEQIYVEYPRLTEIFERIEECHDQAKWSVQPNCLAIMGRSSAGKTTIWRKYSQRYPHRITPSGTEVPVFAATLPKSPSIKSVASDLLAQLGDPLPDKGSTGGQRSRKLVGLLQDTKVELILLDEFQHLNVLDENRPLYDTADWVKGLYNLVGKPIVIFGLPYIEDLLEANEQLGFRFSMRMTLDPFGWERNEEREEFRKFLWVVDKKLPFTHRAGLGSTDLAARIYWATGGWVGRVMKLVKLAGNKAVKRQQDPIGLDAFEAAFKELHGGRQRSEINPFLKSIDASALPPAPVISTPEPRAAKKSKPPRANRLLRARDRD